jgi:hypothetical protein
MKLHITLHEPKPLPPIEDEEGKSDGASRTVQPYWTFELIHLYKKCYLFSLPHNRLYSLSMHKLVELAPVIELEGPDLTRILQFINDSTPFSHLKDPNPSLREMYEDSELNLTLTVLRMFFDANAKNSKEYDPDPQIPDTL